MSAYHSISRMTFPMRPPDHVVAVGSSPETAFRWEDLWRGAANVAAHAQSHGGSRWVLYTETVPRFLMGFLGLLHAGKEIVLPASMQPGLLAEAGGPGAGILDEGALAALAEEKGRQAPRFPPLDPHHCMLCFYTSGSSGAPKSVPKALFQVEAEVDNLHAVWGEELQGRAFHSSVSHQHIYGFLFSAMLPLCMGQPIAMDRISVPDALEALQGDARALVLSPAFLKRALQVRTEPYAFDPPPVIFCAGGALPRETAQAAERTFATRLHDVYGSTETGGIAYRVGGESEPWRCFPGINIRIAPDSGIEVQSPYLRDNEYFAVGDAGRLVAPGTFVLLGRLDSIVKIEEKRVALSEVESRLRESPLVEDAHVIALERARQFLAAVIVLSQRGKDFLCSDGRRAVTSQLRNHLLAWFEPIVIPRKWRYLDAIPRDTQGKVLRESVVELFTREDKVLSAGLPQPRSVEKNGDRLVVSITFPPESEYFDGHFPTFPLLPGVVQVDCVMRLARQHLGVMQGVAQIRRIKFVRPIRPGDPLRVEIQLNAENGTIQFSYEHEQTGQAYSSGRLVLRRAQ